MEMTALGAGALVLTLAGLLTLGVQTRRGAIRRRRANLVAVLLLAAGSGALYDVTHAPSLVGGPLHTVVDALVVLSLVGAGYAMYRYWTANRDPGAT